MGGAEVDEAGRAFRVGFVAPYLGLYDALTPAEHLGLVIDGPERAGWTRRALRDRTDAVLEAVGLAPRAHDRVGAFSTGLRQRVRLALALLAPPPLLVLDEPTATLDGAGTALVDALRRAQVASGGLLVVATNDPREAAWGVQRVAVGGAE